MSRIFETLTRLEEEKQIGAVADPLFDNNVEKPTSDLEKCISLSPSFLIDTLREIRKTASLIYKLSLLALDQAEDREGKEHDRMILAKAFDQILSVVDMLSTYINVTSPIIKRNTIHSILEELLESNESKFRAKQIQLKKSLAQELPETTLHDDQLRFLLNLAIQYVLLSAPSGGGIELTTQFANNPGRQDSAWFDVRTGPYIGIQVVSSQQRARAGEPHGDSAMAGVNDDGRSDFLFRLMREMVARNRSEIDLRVDRMASGIRISLKLPVERRRPIYYRLI